ncbi:basic proline-rich protein-like isoform X6 [Serinus canaria]|uniref:basic proline-rich protein-like isoform X6 n=1 Tax=Serinus canaria TaxID=9135 RepID=UPI0021CCB015|nr:basic proline-rich protein-like isoform X6 [Serinus canaria]
MAAKRIPQLLGPSGRMFPPPGCRRSFPREPAPWWDGPWPGHPGGPEDAWDGPPWDGPPWEEQPRRRRRRRCPPSSRTFPGPGDGPWNEEEGDRRWAPPGCPLPPPWGDREAVPGAEDDFGECWYRDPPPDPWPEYPEEEQPQPWSPSGSPGNPGNFHQHRPPWSHRPRQSHPRLLIPVPRAWCPRPSRGLKPRSKPSCPAPSRRSQPAARKEPEPPQPPAPPRGAAERPEQPQDVPVGTGNVLEPPSPARSPRESPAADPGAAEPQVELEAEQIPEGSQDRDPCAPGTDPAPPEETSRHAEVQEHLEAVCGQQQLCPELPTPFPAGIDSRSAAVLRRKAKIELSYQQFSLSVAVVATMLLQKEPSMEAALGLALRANLRQGRLHHLQQLEEFIDSLDSVGSSSL